jgi:pimeloyl-ACP methyl ester carboxylesterase
MTRERSVELRPGLRLPYVEQGDPGGVPVLLLHGVTDSWRSFERVLPHLPASLRVFALTQRGHGDADRPATGYRARDFADDVAAFTRALGLGPVVIVGHSMGATNAVRFALDHPARTLGLVLVAAFAGYRDNPVVTDFVRTGVARLEDPIDPAFVREFQRTTLAQPVPPDFFETVVGESLKVPARVWRAAFAAFLGDSPRAAPGSTEARVWRAAFAAFLEDDGVGERGGIAAPTLVVWGARDAFCPRADQDALVGAIAGARLLVYERAGHAVHWEEPERFAADLAAFAGGLGR